MANCFVIYSLFFPKSIWKEFSLQFVLLIHVHWSKPLQAGRKLLVFHHYLLLLAPDHHQFNSIYNSFNFSISVLDFVYPFSSQLLFSMFLDRWLLISMICPRMLSLYILTFLYTFVVFTFASVLSISDMVFVLFILIKNLLEKNILYLLKMLSQIFTCGNPTVRL